LFSNAGFLCPLSNSVFLPSVLSTSNLFWIQCCFIPKRPSTIVLFRPVTQAIFFLPHQNWFPPGFLTLFRVPLFPLKSLGPAPRGASIGVLDIGASPSPLTHQAFPFGLDFFVSPFPLRLMMPPPLPKTKPCSSSPTYWADWMPPFPQTG